MESLQTISAQRFQRLQDYLNEGWWIDPPIFVRPVWHTQHRSQQAFHFILKRDESLHLLVVPCSPLAEQFVQESKLSVNYL